MTLALYGKSRQRQGGLLLVGLLAVLVAMIAGVATITSVFAHHNTYSKTGTCEGWTATSNYVGGLNKVLIIMDNVVIGGQNYQGSWSSGFETGPGTSGGVLQYSGGQIDGKNLPSSGTGAITDLTNVHYWFGTDSGAQIFNRNGSWPAGSFSGRLLLYYVSGGNWSFSLSDSVTPSSGDQGTITAPTRPSDCDRTIRVRKFIQGSGAPSQTFSYTISPAGVSDTLSASDTSDDHDVPKNAGQTVKETESLSGGWSFVKYTRRSGLDNDCSGTGWSDQGTVQADGVAIPSDSSNYTVCIYNQYTPPPKVGIDKDVEGGDGKTRNPGDSFWFKVTIKVSATTTLATTVTDTVPAAFEIVSVAEDPDTANVTSCGFVGQTVTCTVPAGAAAGNYDVKINVKVKDSPGVCGTIENVASASGGNADPNDTGDATVKIPCVKLRVCKMLEDSDYSGDNNAFTLVTKWGNETKTLALTNVDEDDTDCSSDYEVPPGSLVSVEETVVPTGWTHETDYPKVMFNSGNATSIGGTEVLVDIDTCGAAVESLVAGLEGRDIQASHTGPDCTVTIINKAGSPDRDLEICKVVVGNGDGFVDGGVFKFNVTGIDPIELVAYEPASDTTDGTNGTAVCKTVKVALGTVTVTEWTARPPSYGWEGSWNGDDPLYPQNDVYGLGVMKETANVPGGTDSVTFYNKTDPRTREITITKHFVELPSGLTIVPERDYPAFAFDPAIEPEPSCTPSGTNPVTWTCTVPADWDGDVTETEQPGWKNVACNGSTAPTLLAEPQTQDEILTSSWTFCNAPYGTVIVNKLNTSASGPNFTATISGLPATDIFGGPLDSSPTIAQGSPSNQTLVPLGNQAYSVTEVNAGTTATCGSGATNYFTIVTAPADTVLDTPGEIQTWTIVNQPCGVLGQGGLVLEKYRDNNGDGTANGSDAYEPWTIKVTGPGGYDQTFILTAAQMPFLVGPLAPGNYTVSELTASGWVAIGLRVDNGALVAAATQTTVAVDGGANVLRGVTFYNQPRVNIEVNKTEISLATPAGAPGNGWSFTLNGCSVGPLVQVTGANGKATFSNLPPAVGCSYTVTETVKGGWSAVNPVQVAAPSAAGQTAVLNFTNVKIEVCIDCRTILETPTPETPTATETPETPSATPETPTEEPKEEPTLDETRGERTPGPQTPVAPSTGTGFTDGGASGMSMLFALVGLVAISLGTTILALGRKSSRR